MTTTSRPFAFTFYFVSLVVLLLAALVLGALYDPDIVRNLAPFVALTLLFAIAERTDLSYYDGTVRWGLSASEAILIPMLFVLSPTQVVIGAVVAIASLTSEWKDPSKHVFNVAEFGCAALLAVSIWTFVEDPVTTFGLRDAVAAVLAAVAFSLTTQALVGVAIQLAGQGRVWDAFGDVRATIVFGLSGSVVVGLFGAAAFAAAPWMLFLFPIALAGLYFGYRAVARQAAERTRVERLHEATRSLATSSDLPKALEGFLAAVADVLSTTGARAIIDTRGGIVSSTFYDGEVLGSMQRVEGSGIESILDYVRETRRPLVFGPDHEPVPEALREGGSHNVLAVPVMEDDGVCGLLIASDRVGADDFGDDDIKLLEALAGDLSLTLQTSRLFGQVTEERERFQLLVESVTDYAIYLVDPQGHVVSWNSGAERILGYRSEDIIGRHHSAFYPLDMHGAWHEELNEAKTKGRSETEGQRLRQDGSLFVANEVITPVRSQDGTITGFAKVTRDVTERVRTEAEKETLQNQLHQAQRLESVGQLAGGVAHDFNNLLSVITNSANFALESIPTDSSAVEDLVDIRDASKRARELTRQLLIFSRRDLIKPEPVNLNAVVASAVKLLRRALGELVILRTELDEAVGPVKADPGQLEQVLMNLAINARDAMAGGGTISIETSPFEITEEDAAQYVDLLSGPHVRMTISDTGSGMNPEVAQKAFDPFFTTKPKGRGTGLGLATVYGIVKSAGGHINVLSKEGLGTTFEIIFPVAAEPPAAVTPDPQDGSAPRGNGETILVVEDDDSVRAITKKLLERRGYSVIETSKPKQALSILNVGTTLVDLMLTDIVMPDMTGVELAQRARSSRNTLKIVYMSGYSPGVFSTGGAELEGELIQKPFEETELLQVVRRTLDGSIGQSIG